MSKISVLLLSIFIPAFVAGQPDAVYLLESDVIAGGGNYSPFYFQNNRHGLVSFMTNSGYLRGAFFKNDNRSGKFGWSLGIDGLVGYHQPSVCYLHQAYVNLRWHVLELGVGSREEEGLLQNFRLSSGGMVWSGNARPVPQLRAGIPQYIRIPGTKGWVWIRGEISYGLFCDNGYQRKTHAPAERYAKNVWYHRKYLMIKIENEAPFFGSAGIDMAAQFGGTVYNTSAGTIVFGHRVKDFLKVFVPSGGDRASPAIDQVNIVGNHLGSYLMEIGYKRKSWRLRGYYEHYFDDHSGMIFRNFPDGLWGVEWTTSEKGLLTGVVGEYVCTTSQSGPFLWDENEYIPVQVSGGDDYYGHAAYPGWTYWGRTIGNPFLTSPGYNSDGYMGFRNTRVRACHLGLEGYFGENIGYRLLAGYAKGWGTPAVPFREVSRTLSGLAECTYILPRSPAWYFVFSAAADRNKGSRDNWGIQVRVGYRGQLSLSGRKSYPAGRMIRQQ